MAAAGFSTRKSHFASSCPPVKRRCSGASDLLRCDAVCLRFLQLRVPALRWRSRRSCTPECRRVPMSGTLQLIGPNDLAVCNAATMASGGHFSGRKGSRLLHQESTQNQVGGWQQGKVKRLASCCAVVNKERADVRIHLAVTFGGAHIIMDGRLEPIHRNTSAVAKDARCGPEGRRFFGSKTTDSPGTQGKWTEKEERARVAAEQVRFAPASVRAVQHCAFLLGEAVHPYRHHLDRRLSLSPVIPPPNTL
jgi:hypothetical protein